MAIQVSNIEFLQAIFRENWQFAHVTGFPDDPSHVTSERRAACWAGDYIGRAAGMLRPGWNQYFTISVFKPDDRGRAVRRKGNFVGCYCIVADDVGEKIPPEQAALLPEPSWILETSPGNYQYGWIIIIAETDRPRVENLLDGLVARGLAPEGKDPGMKGVTRYVRLPEGSNTKAKYGPVPFQNVMHVWRPDRKTTLEALAAPFAVDLNAARKGESTYSAGNFPDHPIFEYVTVLDQHHEKGFLIECPWIEEHTERSTDGTWLTINNNGTLGFNCFHGHCADRNTTDFLNKLGATGPVDFWRAFRGLDKVVMEPPAPAGGNIAGIPEPVAGTIAGTAGTVGTNNNPTPAQGFNRNLPDQPVTYGTAGAPGPEAGAGGPGVDGGASGPGIPCDGMAAGAASSAGSLGPDVMRGFESFNAGAGFDPGQDQNGQKFFCGSRANGNLSPPGEGLGINDSPQSPQGPVDFMHGPAQVNGADLGQLGGNFSPNPQAVDFMNGPAAVPQAPVARPVPMWEQAIDSLPPDPSSDEALLNRVASGIVQLGTIERGRAVMVLKHKLKGFLNAKDVDRIIKEAEKVAKWEAAKASTTREKVSGFAEICNTWVYVAEINRFVNPTTGQGLTVDAFKNLYVHLEEDLASYAAVTNSVLPAEIVKAALSGPMRKVNDLDYRPGSPVFFSEDGKSYLNLWNHTIDPGAPGDVTQWLQHFKAMGFPQEDIDHVLDFLACTLQKPYLKINHILVFGGREGIGKDFILFPIKMALGAHSQTIEGRELLADFNEYLLKTKHLHINELESGNHRDRSNLTAKLKPLATRPPDTLSINQKNVSRFTVRNVVNVTAATNDRNAPVTLSEGARRYYMLWSDISIRNPSTGQVTEEWSNYWETCWNWIRQEANWKACIYFLMTRDISRFDPGSPPRVTEHQQHIIAESKSPLAEYLQDALIGGAGVYSRDLITAEQVFNQLALGGETLLHKYGMRQPPRLRAIHQVLTDDSRIVKRRAARKRDGVTAWYTFYIVRNCETYLKPAMSDSEIIGTFENYPQINIF